MKCPNCQSEVKDGMRFCSKCGNEVPQKRICPSCGSEIADADMRFCKDCGSPLSAEEASSITENKSNENTGIKCPICNAVLSIDDQQCPSCHRALLCVCHSCKHDITYGQIFKAGGNCPHCGKRIASLSIIPNDKYPFYDATQAAGTQVPDSHKKSNSFVKYIVLFVAALLVGGIYFYYSNNKQKTMDELLYKQKGSSYNDSQYREELKMAEAELGQASRELNEILPYYMALIQQYGGGQMSVVAAAQNNPQLCRQFENAESRYESCFRKIANIYDKMGLTESGDAYRRELGNWQSKIRRLRGMP